MSERRVFATLLVGLFSLFRTPTLAGEQPIALKDGPGREVVEMKCGICHSLDYVPMNSPFLDEKSWQAEVAKMISAFGAPLEPDQAKIAVDYLVNNYGVGSASAAPK
jgi:sulfite dehydrogenase (cytochrome) subunit B